MLRSARNPNASCGSSVRGRDLCGHSCQSTHDRVVALLTFVRFRALETPASLRVVMGQAVVRKTGRDLFQVHVTGARRPGQFPQQCRQRVAPELPKLSRELPRRRGSSTRNQVRFRPVFSTSRNALLQRFQRRRTVGRASPQRVLFPATTALRSQARWSTPWRPSRRPQRPALHLLEPLDVELRSGLVASCRRALPV